MKLSNVNIDELTSLNCFESRGELIEYLILECMSISKETMGSWTLKVLLDGRGVSISIASVGRALMILDAKGYTKLVSTKGRHITEKGISYLSEKRKVAEHKYIQRRMDKSASPDDFCELLDLIRARRALESESARLAAIRATDLEKDKIMQGLREHQSIATCGKDPTGEAFNFHIKVAESTHSHFIIAAIQLFIFYNEQMEYKFPYLVTRDLGMQFYEDHQEIAKAILKSDPQNAESLMWAHMTNILEAIKKQEGSETTS